MTSLRRAAPDKRKGAKREPYDKVLIVTEGECTEVFYFTALRNDFRLSSVNIQVQKGKGSAPISVVETAIALEQRARKDKNPFDRIFCVIDRDEHSTFDQAINLISSKSKIQIIDSTPSFELWLLLHFVFHTAPIVRSGKKSPGEMCCSLLKKHLLDYLKGNENIYEQLKPRMKTALENAKKLHIQSEQTNSKNPLTLVHQLVEYLQVLKYPKQQ